MGGDAAPPIRARSLVRPWNKFREGFRLRERRELDRFPVVVVLGAVGSVTEDVVRAYAGSEQRVSENLLATTNSSHLNVHLGAHVIVQELADTVLSDTRPETGEALLRLWRKTFRRLWGLLPAPVSAPVVVLVLEPSRLSGLDSTEVRNVATAIRGKIDLLGRVCGHALEVRIALTQLSTLHGFASYARLVQALRLDTDVSLEATGNDEGMSQALRTFGTVLPQSLVTQSPDDCRGVTAFCRALPALASKLAILVEGLGKHVRMRETPLLTELVLTDTTEAPSRWGSNPLRPGSRKETLPREYLLWPHRWFTILGSIALSFYAISSYLLEEQRFSSAIASLEAYPKTLCNQGWRKNEIEARAAVAEFVSGGVKTGLPLPAFPFFASAAPVVARKASVLFRDRLLLPATALSISNGDSDSQIDGLFLLGLLHAPGNEELKQLALGEDLPEFVTHTPFDTESLRGYLAAAPPPDLGGLTLPVPHALPVAEVALPWQKWLADLNDFVRDDADASPGKLSELKRSAQTQQDSLKKRLRWIGQHWLAYDILDRLEDDQPAQHYKSTLGGLMPRTGKVSQTAQERNPLLSLVLSISTPRPLEGDYTLQQAMQDLWAELCTRHELAARPQDAHPSTCGELSAPLGEPRAWSDVISIPKPDGESGAIYSSINLLRTVGRMRMRFIIAAFTEQVERAIPADDAAPSALGDPGRKLLGLSPGAPLKREIYLTHLKPLFLAASSLSQALAPLPALRSAWMTAVDRLAVAYGESYGHGVTHELSTVEASFADLFEKGLSSKLNSLGSPSAALQLALSSAQQITDVRGDAQASSGEDGPLSALADALGRFDLPSPQSDGEALDAALSEYQNLLRDIANELAQGAGSSATERLQAAAAEGREVRLADLLSPAARLVLPILAGAEDSVQARFDTWRLTAQIPPLLTPMFEAPILALRDLGLRRLREIGAAVWEASLKPQLKVLSGHFPFDPHSATDASPASLIAVLHPAQGSLPKTYDLLVAPLVRGGHGLVPRELHQTWSRIQALQRQLWREDGAPKAYGVSVELLPFDSESGLERIELRSGERAELPYVNQAPMPMSVAIPWLDAHDAELTARVRTSGGADASSFISTPRSHWALLHLTKQLVVEAKGPNGCIGTWTLAAPRATARKPAVRLRFEKDPFAPFALLQESSLCQKRARR